MSQSVKFSRRQWLTTVGKVGAAGAALMVAPAFARDAAKVIVVGGGFGGATAAKYIKRRNPAIDVTLIEPAKTYYTCPFTNLYFGGLRTYEQQGHNFDEMRDMGVQVIHDLESGVDANKKTVSLKGGDTLS